MDKTSIKLLLVENNPGDARLLREMLREQSTYNADVTHVETMAETEKYVAGNSVDIIVLDLGLIDVQGLDAVRRAYAAAPLIPLVVLSGLDDESLAMQALQEGAQDYMLKGQINTRGLIRALRHAIERKSLDAKIHNDFIELKRAEAELRDRELMLRLALDVSQQGVFRWEVAQNSDGLEWDARCKAMFGLAPDKLVNHGVWANIVHTDDRVATQALLTRALDPADAQDAYSSEYRAVLADGTVRWLSATGRAMFESDPAIASGRRAVRVIGTIRDVSLAKRADQEREMQNSTQRLLAKVFMSVDDAVTIVNAAGRFVMTNPRADSLLGYKSNELIGKNSAELMAPEARAAVNDSIKKQFEHGSDLTYVAPVLRADGSRFVATVTSVLVATDEMKQFRIITVRSNEVGKAGMRTESAGRIKLVGLDDVRLALGDRWPAVADRAMATAEAVVKRRCGEQDSFSRADDTSFLICFGALSEQESSFRAAMIGREIHDRLIGQGSDPDTAFVRSIAASVRFPDQGETGASLHVVLMDGLNSQLERLEREARQTLQAALANAVCELKPISGRNGGETLATQVSLPIQLERSVVAALAVLPAVESKAFDQDGLLIGLAAQHAIVTMGRGEPTPVVVNVRFDVFATRPATERFLATCHKIDQRVSSRLILLLSSLPQGLPKTRLLECINRLRPFCRGVGYLVDDIAGLALIDLTFSATPIVSLPAAAFASIDPNKLKLLIGALHARRAKVLIREVASDEDAAAFRSHGADMVSLRSAAVRGVSQALSKGSGNLAA